MVDHLHDLQQLDFSILRSVGGRSGPQREELTYLMRGRIQLEQDSGYNITLYHVMKYHVCIFHTWMIRAEFWQLFTTVCPSSFSQSTACKTFTGPWQSVFRFEGLGLTWPLYPNPFLYVLNFVSSIFQNILYAKLRTPKKG